MNEIYQLEKLYIKLERHFTSDKSASGQKETKDMSRKSTPTNNSPKYSQHDSADRQETVGVLLEELKNALSMPGCCRLAAQLFKLQGLLIKTSDLLATWLSEVSDDQTRSAIYTCLKRLVLRPELSLQAIGYDKE